MHYEGAFDGVVNDEIKVKSFDLFHPKFTYP